MSLYRVSTANSYDATLNRINQRTAELTQTQEKLSAGKRVLRATDDPVAATLAEREGNRLSRVQADLRALERSRSSLVQAESTLGNAVDLMHRFKELMVQGGNAALSATDRRSIAQEMSGLRDQLLNLANAQDSEGNALFGGLGVTNTLGKPFADVYGTNPGVDFQAIGGQGAATETGLPNRVDGQYALMRNLTGNGTFTVANVSGNVLVTGGSLLPVEPPPAVPPSGAVLPFDGSATTQGRYTLTVAESTTTPGTLELQVAVVPKDVTPPIAAPAIAPINLGAHTPGQPLSFSNRTVQFDGVQLTLSGSAAPGDEFRIEPSEAGDLFASMERAIKALQSDGSSTYRTQELGRVHEETQTGLDRLLLVRGRLGEYLRRADSLEARLQDRGVDHEKQLSNLTDLDMVKGISEFQNQQLGLQAALQSYAQVQKLSLFQYIA
ncbi:flagellar hook-associated protein FlgL [Aquabacterium sp. A08]|uniref:flagellar hook-associated protein FlgL n=1 Tax=Aquabacterium sp. A08 TaxID=2718532 RepID=UPI00141D96AE|nr:flagellar hook-associated protein FlgL [Aquabacterium sp. A08]NIC43655.1 flagellar hook-associated protein 3 [Aquabacterium sp. A08]